MEWMYEDEDVAQRVTRAIQTGDTSSLEQLLLDHSGLAKTKILERNPQNKGGCSTVSRTLLHIATDWPGHFPNVTKTIRMLTGYGAEVNAPMLGANHETPLHWAASCDDVQALDALIDAGADIEASGAVIAGGTPLDDAVAFAQWNTARRLVERGALTALWHAAALGKIDAIKNHFKGKSLPEYYPWTSGSSSAPTDTVNISFWCACHGGQQEAAAYLLQQGAELNWAAAWDGSTPLDTVKRNGFTDLVTWLERQGAKGADNINREI
ncbi:hypothetical protein GCM10008014_09500 [Paenibacillus silvae]|uniref:Ankyrin repeat domain-containing protein n=1 Tax=Paenibacillus silvae TaxID=1325358 RepID=A0ABQ1Z4C1_9BACL|nr:ankyrin repeat domain-containing protein [Paenibacillus silvae]GGH46695.1 hypothetical protein GCM10008014_09500 [Paenibacillus silvae]